MSIDYLISLEIVSKVQPTGVIKVEIKIRILDLNLQILNKKWILIKDKYVKVSIAD